MNSPLKQVRLKRGKTIQEVADAVGIDTGNLSRIERGLQVPSKSLTEKLARFFDNDVTETQIIYPERFAQQNEPTAAEYAGTDHKTGESAAPSDKKAA